MDTHHPMGRFQMVDCGLAEQEFFQVADPIYRSNANTCCARNGLDGAEVTAADIRLELVGRMPGVPTSNLRRGKRHPATGPFAVLPVVVDGRYELLPVEGFYLVTQLFTTCLNMPSSPV